MKEEWPNDSTGEGNLHRVVEVCKRRGWENRRIEYNNFPEKSPEKLNGMKKEKKGKEGVMQSKNLQRRATQTSITKL